MFHSLTHSLLLRVGLIMAALTLLAVSSMMTSVFIGRTIQGAASAVNIAGSLRMQSYRIATRLLSAGEVDRQIHWQTMQGLIQNFESSLYGPALADVLPGDGDHQVRANYQSVKQHWRREIRPLLDAYVDGILPNDQRPALAPKTWGMISDMTVASLRTRYLAGVAKFVDQIDGFVLSISSDAETRIQRLRSFQWIALFFTLVIVLFALDFAKRKVVTPMQDLLSLAGAAARGDFSVRTPHTGTDELGRMGFAFNDMSRTLSKLYGDLEERVRIKTKDLEQSNRSLGVLYKTVNRLSGKPFPHVTYQGLLEEITTLAGTGPAVICLNGSDEAKAKAHQLATTRNLDDSLMACKASDCSTCLGKGDMHFFDQPCKNGSQHSVISLPIKEGQQHHGVLLVEARDSEGFADWQKRVLEAVASHIGMAITMSGLHAEQSRLALLTERSAIARELHDSLAQSLSYAKIQVSRLNHILKEFPQESEARDINDELRDGLNRAYRELRELLTTFRLTMDDDDLNQTILKTVEEFGQRGLVKINFVGDCPRGLLAPNEEIHLLQIIRESLSNILRHSKATRATISLHYCDAGNIKLEIIDNGIGIDELGDDLKRQHYGLVIMRERALNLGGDFNIKSSQDGEGTQIMLSFIPEAQRNMELDKDQQLDITNASEAVTV